MSSSLQPILLFALVLAFSRPASAELILQESVPAGPTEGRVLGNVRTVLDGASTGSQFRTIPPGTFLYALGAAATGPDPAAQGEALLVGSAAFVKTLEPGCQYCTRHAGVGGGAGGSTGAPAAGFLAGIASGAEPIARYELRQTTSPVSVEELYQALADRHGKLIAVAGVGRFAILETSAVRKAPAYGEPILGSRKSEYFHPKGILEDVDALFFGLVLRSVADSTSETQTVFYVNPDDRATTSAQSHTHFAVVRESNAIDPARPESAQGRVTDIAHLLTQSRLTRAEVVVYPIEELRPVP